jgi:16S rRNA (uracil1498-N3)-methyltransferase
VTRVDAAAAAHVFVDALDDRCVIIGDDGHHLERVRRVRVGEIVTAADTTGAWRSYVVAEVGPGRLVLDARDGVSVEAAPAAPVAVAVALTKAGLDEVVAAVTEIGVDCVIPIRTQRSVVRWDSERAQRAVRRWRTIAREAAMQSRRARIPRVDDVSELTAVASRPGLVVADRNGRPATELAPAGSAGWTVLVGPEGGLAPEELTAVGSAPRLRLGPHVLRAATAPVAAAAILVAEATRVSPE